MPATTSPECMPILIFHAMGDRALRSASQSIISSPASARQRAWSGFRLGKARDGQVRVAYRLDALAAVRRDDAVEGSHHVVELGDDDRRREPRGLPVKSTRSEKRTLASRKERGSLAPASLASAAMPRGRRASSSRSDSARSLSASRRACLSLRCVPTPRRPPLPFGTASTRSPPPPSGSLRPCPRSGSTAKT